MIKFLQALVQYILRLFFSCGVMLVGGSATMMMVAGCASTPVQPVVVVKHVLVSPPDNLLVDCEVAAPPAKADYLHDYSVTATAPGTFVDLNGNVLETVKGAYQDTVPWAALMKTAQERERQLTELNLKHYRNADACNKRLKNLRAWKAQSIKALADPAPKE